MKLFLPKKSLLILFVSLLLVFSCKKNEINNSGNTPDLSTEVNASVSGFVTDENGQAVLNAQVKFGSLASVTDKYGFFEIKNANVVKNAAVVTVTKQGYFKGIKTFVVSANQSPFCRIKLIPKTITGTIDATGGGSVSLANGLQVTLPANAVVNATSNATYSGTVNVSSAWIDPTADDLYKLVPGSLWGVDKDGTIQSLQTYGMAGVELTGASGELLQIATGKKAILTVKLPAALVADAPATIPLWYFDETKGYWKEEGTATKSGDTYSGEVGHFSFWNYDFPFSAIKFTCKVTDVDGNPIANQVLIFHNHSFFCKDYFITDSNGEATGWVFKSAYLLAVTTDDYCELVTRPVSLPDQLPSNGTDEPVYHFDDVIIPPANVAKVIGNVADCNGLPFTNGFVIVSNSEKGYRKLPLNNSGAFSSLMTFCGASENVNFIAENTGTLQTSATLNIWLTSGENDLGTLRACGFTAEQFMDYTIDQNSYSFNYPLDNFGNDFGFLHAEDTVWPSHHRVFMDHTYNNNITPGSSFTTFALRILPTRRYFDSKQYQ